MSAAAPSPLTVVAERLGRLAAASASRRRLVRRARALGESPTARGPAENLLLRRARESRLDAVAGRFLPRPALLRARLAATGRAITIGRYAIGSLAIVAVCLLVLRAFGASPLIALLAGTAAGLWLPHLVVSVLIARRRARFLKLFAEAIGLIVRGLRAGLPVTETITVVGREIADPVGEEFRRAADQVRLGRPLEEALWQTARRLGLPEFNFLVISLSVQRETGGNLAETLENLEQILRRRQQMRLKIKAMSSEAKASALIVGSLPFVMGALMLLVSPAYFHTLLAKPLGHLLLAGGGTSLALGALIMRQMVRFEI